MSTLSVRLPDALLRELNHRAQVIHISRAEYIRKAIELMNAETKKQESRQQLIKASLRVRGESMKVNAEFSRIEYDPDNKN